MKNRPQERCQSNYSIVRFTLVVTFVLAGVLVGCGDQRELTLGGDPAGDAGYQDTVEVVDSAGTTVKDVGGAGGFKDVAAVADVVEIHDAEDPVDVLASVDAAVPVDVARPVDAADEVVPPEGECEFPRSVDVLALANASRAAEGIAALRCDSKIARAARLHAEDMCAQNYFSHVSLDGRTYLDRFNAQGVTHRGSGENIANGYGTAAQVHQGWMASAGHRRNIMNGVFDRLSVGFAQCATGIYWVQDFAG